MNILNILIDYEFVIEDQTFDTTLLSTNGVRPNERVRLLACYRHDEEEPQVTITRCNEATDDTANVVRLSTFDDAVVRAVLNVWTFKGRGG